MPSLYFKHTFETLRWCISLNAFFFSPSIFSTQNICYSNIMSFWLLQQQLPKQIKLLPLDILCNIFLGNRNKFRITCREEEKKNARTDFYCVHWCWIFVRVLFFCDCCDHRDSMLQRKDVSHIGNLRQIATTNWTSNKEMNSQVFMRRFFLLIGTRTKHHHTNIFSPFFNSIVSFLLPIVPHSGYNNRKGMCKIKFVIFYVMSMIGQ